MKKRLLAIGLMVAVVAPHADAQSLLRSFKKKVLDFNPVTSFWQVTPHESLLDDTDSLKNRMLRIGALSFERSLCPSVGGVAKRYVIDASAHALGPDKEIIHYGPLIIDGQTFSYYMINFMYNVTFAEGDLGQKVAYTLYKMFVRKECARFLYRQVARALTFLRVTNMLHWCLCGFIEKKAYRAVLSDVAKRAIRITLEEAIDETVGRPYAFALIYPNGRQM